MRPGIWDRPTHRGQNDAIFSAARISAQADRRRGRSSTRSPGSSIQILDDDGSIAAKQRHTAKRIFERLRDEHGYGGGYTTVKSYVRVRQRQRRGVRAVGIRQAMARRILAKRWR